MNSFTSPTSPTGVNGPGAPAHQQRPSFDSSSNLISDPKMRPETNGAMPVPVATPQRSFQTAAAGGMAQGPMSGMPRSPPKNKNTAHVPCKFFLQGQCQAGRTCPFSHDIESSKRPAPCKYFAKGGCKFGRKCALLHITPDGTVVNRMPPPSFQHAQGQQPFIMSPSAQAQAQLGSYGHAPPGLLSIQAQGLEQRQNAEQMHEFDNYQHLRDGQELPHIDMTYSSASPTYGSPTQDFRFGASPSQKGLSVLDAPLPNSFDSNGVSMAARNGPFAASVPSRFGLESPPSSLPRKSNLGNNAVRDLHNSAFGDRGMDGVLASMGSSPPSGADEPLTFPKRSLHSERLRATQPVVSASLGTRLPIQSFEDSDDGGDTDREEDLLPASLHDLIPDGKTRRESRNRIDDETPAAFLAAQRRSISHHGTPQDSKLGSPQSSSPSRYTGVFAARPHSGKVDLDGMGRVSSPLRNSGFAYAASSQTANGDSSPSLHSPQRQASMSTLTQSLQRNKLDATRSQAPTSTQATVPAAAARSVSNGSSGRKSLDRGIGSAGVGKIEEEQELFDMDELGGPPKTKPRSIPNRTAVGGGGAWNTKPFGSPPGSLESGFGAIGGHRAAK